MVEVNDRVAIVRDHSIVKLQRANPAPVLECPPLAKRGSARDAMIGDFDVEGQSALWLRITFVENLCHHLVPEIEPITLDSGLFGRHQDRFRLVSPAEILGGRDLLGSAANPLWLFLGGPQ
jgi:hypothetical protein